MPKRRYPIDLGKTMTGPIGVPSLSGESEEPSDEKFFPSVQLEWDDDYELPESGTITFRFKKASETNDKQGQRVSLDLTEIVSSDADKEEEEESTGDRLDKEMKKAVKKGSRKKKAEKEDLNTFEDNEGEY